MENFTLDTLTALPLFQGIGKSELTQFSTSVPHRIVQYAEGENLAEQDHPCRQLILAFRGTIGMRTRSDNNRFAGSSTTGSSVRHYSTLHAYLYGTDRHTRPDHPQRRGNLVVQPFRGIPA